MSFRGIYRAQAPGAWTGRVDDPNDRDSFRWHQVIEYMDLSNEENKPLPEDTTGFCFLGFCCDKGVEYNLGRPGASKAPPSIRKEMANLPLRFDEKTRIFDGGDIYCDNMDLAKGQMELASMVERIFSLNFFPIVLGGGHEIAFGHYNGIMNSIPEMASPEGKQAGVGIVNFDAHFDLRPYGGGANSGTMFLQIADGCKETNRDFSYFCLGVQQYGNTISLFKKAEELKARYVLAKEMDDSAVPGIMEQLDEFISGNDYIYLTLCADVFSSAFAPGVSASQPFGLHPEIVLKLIKHVIGSGKVISMDIAEVSPRFDEDNRTSKLAAIIIFAIINTLSELS